MKDFWLHVNGPRCLSFSFLRESPKYIQKQISYNCSDLEQSNVTEETPEGEEHPVADTENK